MRRYEREALRDRIRREGSTVGASIPERLTVSGEPVELRATVLSLQRAAPLTAAEAKRCQELVRGLRRERLDRIDQLEHADISWETGERLVERVIGIDRALEALSGIEDPTDIETEIQRQELADTKRWHAFLDRARRPSKRRGLR